MNSSQQSHLDWSQAAWHVFTTQFAAVQVLDILKAAREPDVEMNLNSALTQLSSFFHLHRNTAAKPEIWAKSFLLATSKRLAELEGVKCIYKTT